jgi:hypothetical protein
MQLQPYPHQQRSMCGEPQLPCSLCPKKASPGPQSTVREDWVRRGNSVPPTMSVEAMWEARCPPCTIEKRCSSLSPRGAVSTGLVKCIPRSRDHGTCQWRQGRSSDGETPSSPRQRSLRTSKQLTVNPPAVTWNPALEDSHNPAERLHFHPQLARRPLKHKT